MSRYGNFDIIDFKFFSQIAGLFGKLSNFAG